MKIYFAGSIRGGREKAGDYKKIIEKLSTFSEVLTEHIGNKELSSHGEVSRTDEEIYVRDVSWIDEADIIVADVTVASLGVGYELGYGEARGKKILCLYEESEGKRLSAMISGNKTMKVVKYSDINSLIPKLEEIINSL